MNESEKPLKIEGSIFTFIAELFHKRGVKSVLVGGYALAANNVQRMTFDIDFMITLGDYEKIEQELLGAGYSLFNKKEAFIQLKSSIVGQRDLDFLISDEKTITTVISQGHKVTIAGKSFIVPSPMHLIEMKLHSIAGNSRREMKDLPDIVQLMKTNAIDSSEERVKKLFEKYRLVEMYERVQFRRKD
jgi:hypothetical protein